MINTLLVEDEKEIQSIRNRYLVHNNENNKLNYLRQLNNKVKNTPTIISLIVGIVGILIFGLGFTMVVKWDLIAWGVVVSCVLMLLAYPLYLKVDKY